VRIGSGSDLLGPLARYKARELAIKASVLGAHQALIATTKTNAELLRTRWPTSPCRSARTT
jgi:hypothetical protein